MIDEEQQLVLAIMGYSIHKTQTRFCPEYRYHYKIQRGSSERISISIQKWSTEQEAWQHAYMHYKKNNNEDREQF